MQLAGFDLAFPATERLQTHGLGSAVTAVGKHQVITKTQFFFVSQKTTTGPILVIRLTTKGK
jgi:hypothetical protein